MGRLVPQQAAAAATLVLKGRLQGAYQQYFLVVFVLPSAHVAPGINNFQVYFAGPVHPHSSVHSKSNCKREGVCGHKCSGRKTHFFACVNQSSFSFDAAPSQASDSFSFFYFIGPCFIFFCFFETSSHWSTAAALVSRGGSKYTGVCPHTTSRRISCAAL